MPSEPISSSLSGCPSMIATARVADEDPPGRGHRHPRGHLVVEAVDGLDLAEGARAGELGVGGHPRALPGPPRRVAPPPMAVTAPRTAPDPCAARVVLRPIGTALPLG